MGYDLHITRRKDWSDAGDDISRDEFFAVVLKDPSFSQPSEIGPDYVDWTNPRTGEKLWWLCWDDGTILAKNPEPELIEKMTALAKALNAKVQGDDGELYQSSNDAVVSVEEASGREVDRHPLPKAKSWWKFWN